MRNLKPHGIGLPISPSSHPSCQILSPVRNQSRLRHEPSIIRRSSRKPRPAHRRGDRSEEERRGGEATYAAHRAVKDKSRGGSWRGYFRDDPRRVCFQHGDPYPLRRVVGYPWSLLHILSLSKGRGRPSKRWHLLMCSPKASPLASEGSSSPAVSRLNDEMSLRAPACAHEKRG